MNVHDEKDAGIEMMESGIKKSSGLSALNTLLLVVLVAVVSVLVFSRYEGLLVRVEEKDYQEEIAGLKQELMEKTQSAEFLKQELQNRDDAMKQLRDELKSLKGQGGTLDEEKIVLQGQISSMKDQLRVAEQEKLALAGEIQNLKEQLEQALVAEIEAVERESDFLAKLADDDPFTGEENAPVVIVEFCEYQSALCKKFHDDVFGALFTKYIQPGKVKFVFRDFPLSTVHLQALQAAQAAQCAAEQGKFWEYHNILFGNQDSFSNDQFKEWAADLQLDAGQFNNCLDFEKYKAEVEKDLAAASEIGVAGIPAAFINTVQVVGLQPFSVYDGLVQKELNK